jgi:hypothetical protein
MVAPFHTFISKLMKGGFAPHNGHSSHLGDFLKAVDPLGGGPCRLPSIPIRNGTPMESISGRYGGV